jgi:hypothetical protein
MIQHEMPKPVEKSLVQIRFDILEKSGTQVPYVEYSKTDLLYTPFYSKAARGKTTVAMSILDIIPVS